MSEIKIYCYQYNKDLSEKQKQKLLKVLNIFEREKVKNFKQSLDADISLISRFLLRSILSPLVNKKPEEIEFSYNEYNRPYVGGLDFNLSHSGNRIVIVTNQQGRVGVDIEKIRLVEMSLAQICFTKEEMNHVVYKNNFNLDNFFQLWTLKESFIKADGKGMSYPLLDFFFEIDKKIRINFKNDNLENNWQFKVFDIDPEYKMSVCFEGMNRIKAIKQINNLENIFDE